MPNGRMMSRCKMTNRHKKNIYFAQAHVLRRIRGSFTQGNFAKRLGIPLRTYSRYEKGEREMPIGLVKLAFLINKDNKEIVLVDESLSFTDEGASIKEYVDNFKMDLEVITREEAERRKKVSAEPSYIDTSNPSATSDSVKTLDADPCHDLLIKTRLVLESKTGFAKSLAANIVSFHDAVVTAEKLKDHERRLEDLEQKHSTGRGKVEDSDAAQAAGG